MDLADAHYLGGFVLGQAVVVAQGDHLALFFREFLDRFFQGYLLDDPLFFAVVAEDIFQSEAAVAGFFLQGFRRAGRRLGDGAVPGRSGRCGSQRLAL